MTRRVTILYLAVSTAFFVSCTTSKPATSTPADLEGMQHQTLDTMAVYPEDLAVIDSILPEYKPSVERKWDLEHTLLDLSFDWPNETVIGKAILTLTPVFYPQSSIHLNAINFKVGAVVVDGKNCNTYQNTGDELIIALPRTYKKDEELNIEIQYTAHPEASKVEAGATITSDQGLFFIDPLDTIPGEPRQLWSQGETSSNRRWYPTLDQPNERGTQEIILTVADTLMTLSNGLLVSSTPLEGGMRRDDWKLDLPHAPYLAMIAVGKWDKVTDYWRGRPVEYYVDPGYGPSARAIFANTPEMIEFFSRKLGYDFVWPKYSQIIVKKFVSGAMENTTAVVFSDYIQFKKDDIIEDGANDYIVAHELFHHWFGDLVTCESWANITLNEGFANYAEYLWQEYKYGREQADLSRMNELSGYYDQTKYTTHPLIHYHYAEEGDLFDAHSYNKGGLVLHMLRGIVGDDAFFASLKKYLQQHAFSAVEVDDLRQSFEEVTGMDLKWFFDQWYFSKGHPVLDIQHAYDEKEGKLNVEVKQTQSEEGFPDVFRLPAEVAIFHRDSTVEFQKIVLDQKSQVFSFDEASAPLAVVFDPHDILLAVVHHDIPVSEYPLRAMSTSLSVSHRISALRLMTDMEKSVANRLMVDSSSTVRGMMVSYLDDKKDAEALYQMALRETQPELQYYMLETLSGLDPEKAKNYSVRLLEHADKIPIIYIALNAVAAVDIDEALHQASHFQNNTSPAIYAATASIYAKKGNAVGLEYFTTDIASQVEDNYLEEFIGAMALFLSGQPATIQDKGLSVIDSDFFLQTADPQYRRFYLITGILRQYINEVDGEYKDKLLNTVKSLYNKETDAYLKGVLKEGLGPLLD